MYSQTKYEKYILCNVVNKRPTYFTSIIMLCMCMLGTFMLNKGVDEVLFKDGVAWGIKTGNEVSRERKISPHTRTQVRYSVGASFLGIFPLFSARENVIRSNYEAFTVCQTHT